MIKELPIPFDCKGSKESVEVMRAWIIDSCLEVSLLPSIWKDSPETWGLLFADAIRYTADALEEETDQSAEDIRTKIVDLLLRELALASSESEGSYIK